MPGSDWPGSDEWNLSVRTRNITPRVQQLLLDYGVPHVLLKSPIAVRTYPPELYARIRIKDFMDPAVFTEEIAAKNHWIEDMDELAKFLQNWDRRFTMFFYLAFERFEFTPGAHDNVLDEMSAWLRMPKVQLRYHKDKDTDRVWCEAALEHLRSHPKHWVDQ